MLRRFKFPSLGTKRVKIVLATLLVTAILFTAIGFRDSFAQKETLKGRPIVDRDGKTYLWGGPPIGPAETKWWDVTDALIDPKKFDHGLGADRIASIDAPVFGTPEEFRKSANGRFDNPRIIGVEVNGIPRAYPIVIMAQHELVNDTFADAHLTVAY
jgi:hypothetical protein